MAENNIRLKILKDTKKDVYIKQPKYYDKFRCIGGGCMYSCCAGGWRIDWTKSEIDKLMAANCSDELRELAGKSFVRFGVNDQNYAVLYEKDCPFHTEDKMCIIQRELGKEYLSYTCRIYPRKIMVSGDRAIRTCEMSCCEALNMICDNEDSMELEYCKDRVEIRSFNIDSDGSVAKHPELRYRSMLFDFFYEIISDKTRDVSDSIILGAMAARTLTKTIENKSFERIPDLVGKLKESLKDPSNISTVKEIKPNYVYRIGVCAKIVDIAVNPYIMKSMFNEDGSVAADRYFYAEAEFERVIAEKPWLFRNIALNMLFECKMPFFHTDMTLFENYLYYAAAFAAVKMLGPAEVLMCRTNGYNLTAETAFKCALTVTSRKLFNDSGNVGKMMDAVKEYDCMSPAKIALLLK